MAAAVVHAAALGPKSNVLEVGPGLGVMTRLLARRARRVVAVEIDPHLAEWLRADLGDTVEVITDDVLNFDPSAYLVEPYTVVANLPYHITSPALRHLLAAGPPFAERMVVMVQAEVGERIAAQPGEMSSLAVSIQVQADVRVVKHVPAEAFYPRPRVDSAVLVIEPVADHERAIGREDLSKFVAFVQAGFKQPRKTLANSLAEGLGVTRADAVERLEGAGVDAAWRPQMLAVTDWTRLFHAM